jgi:hypothetical protein
LHDKRDGRVAFGEREEGLPAQSPENLGLGKSHTSLDLGLIPRFSRACRKDSDRVRRHRAVGAGDLGVVERGLLEPAISTDGPMGKMVLTVLGMVAEMELGFIKARQRDGIERVKSKGDVYKGRKPTIDRSVVRDLFNEGIGASEIARRLKIGRASVYRVLEQQLYNIRSLDLNSRISNATPYNGK